MRYVTGWAENGGAKMSNALTSWKEIAGYLGKGVRTVQRWEQEFGLPVRRLRNNSHRAILALPEEIDAWVRSRAGSEPTEVDRLRAEVQRLQAELEKWRA